jgi:membrane-associated protease RseP (regulator of RpoE activity)
MIRNGSLTVGRFAGAPVRVHWSTPVGALVFTGFRFAPGAWLGFLALILVHEIGHAVAVRSCRQRVVAVEAHGLGGLCPWEGRATPVQRSLIAWGGVVAQAVAGGCAVLLVAIAGAPRAPFAADLVGAFLATNLWVALVNLMPVAPLDGAEAWKLFPLLAERRRRAREAPAGREIERLARAVEEGDELPPMPEEVRRVLDRVRAEGRAQYDAEKKGK